MTQQREQFAAPAIEVTDVHFRAAEAKWRHTGLLGHVHFTVNSDLRIEAAVRRTMVGALCLSYPAHRDQFGLQHFAVHPIHDRARIEIESQVLGHLRETGIVL